MPKTKGKISPLLAAILRDKEASERLRLAIANGEDFIFHTNGVTYRISTTTENNRSNDSVEKNKTAPKPLQYA